MRTFEDNPQDWYMFAADRLSAADASFEAFGTATFSVIELLHEAVERYLKGFLIAHGWKLKRTHDLADLILDAQAFDLRFAALKPMAESLTNQFFAQHYPGSDLAELGADYAELRRNTDRLLTLIGLKNIGST